MLKPVSVLSIAALALVGLALSACSAEGELDGNLDIGGTEPAYWTVEVNREEGKALISILGEASFEGALPTRSKGEGDTVLLTSTTPQGDFVMSLTHKECFDGLAEVGRPWSVTVTWNGEILTGCARPS